MHFVPLASSPAAGLYASRSLYPKRDRTGGPSGQEEYQRIKSAKADGGTTKKTTPAESQVLLSNHEASGMEIVRKGQLSMRALDARASKMQ